ncbi:hypothetical protein [Chelatococcus reniformis]|uniref:Uncharacterized protein n=1 Tax=Chelatococcus reniformis TaxID=1494448 RepID=A0A916TYT2_9HYPH|nr:hypothetical protein [Chelatococcus reniformis]GGC51872.1 hypothetical protein GCM10010994_08720 [Chelatococcus reniformis]
MRSLLFVMPFLSAGLRFAPAPALFGGLLLAGGLIAPAAAEGVPSLNVRPSCEAAAQLESLDKKQLQACLDDEATARQQTEKEWSTFSASSRRECEDETNLNGTPSYVEMLECLRLARDAKKYPAQ